MKYSLTIDDALYEKLVAIGAPVDVGVNQVISDILWKHIVLDLTERLYDPQKELLDE
jgi:hypothetical protein